MAIRVVEFSSGGYKIRKIENFTTCISIFEATKVVQILKMVTTTTMRIPTKVPTIPKTPVISKQT